MLEIKNVSRTYAAKNEPSVLALDDVSVSFPETGFMFLLGKSGSGKSTMLNVVGGLDAFDSGEIVIKGKSSKEFKEKDFDSYRNTYIGFIFQEYNILEDFTVEKNIALALELQGKKSDSAAVDAILSQVDLKGYGKRKPNQLSGGQRQRVAIARALIKDPQIILADEPTGALDSATSTQVFDTLKRISEKRLVIVVSHDRDFAEQYADRIIEMKDGKILTDTTKRTNQINQVSEKMTVSGNTIFLEPNHTATEKAYLEKLLNENKDKKIVISFDESVTVNFKKHSDYFDKTKKEDIKTSDSKDFKLIKSRFKYWDSLKMGASGLKLKKVRLGFTIFLAAIALMFFGVADTGGSFHASRSMYDSVMASGDQAVSISKQHVINYTEHDYLYNFRRAVSAEDSDINHLKSKFPNHNFVGAHEISTNLGYQGYGTDQYYKSEAGMAFSLSSTPNNNEYEKLGLKRLNDVGHYPTNEFEIAITDYQFECFKALRFKDGTENGKTINAPNDIIGEKITFNEKEYTITTIIDTNFNFERYASLKSAGGSSFGEYMLSGELGIILEFGFSNALFFKNESNALLRAGNKVSTSRYQIGNYYDYNFESNDFRIDSFARTSKMDQAGVIYFDPDKTSPGENEIIISLDALLDEFRISYQVDSNTDTIALIVHSSWTCTYHDSIDSFRTELTAEIRNLFPYMNTSIKMTDDYDDDFIKQLTVVGIYADILTETDIPPEGYTDFYDYTVFIDDSFIDNSPVRFAFAPYKAIQTTLSGNKSNDYALIKYLSDFGSDDTPYLVKNQFSSFYEGFTDTINVIARIFLYVGIGFAVFAALMMMSFITMTISYKKREIGILRAIGATRRDVFKIFFNESLIITTINFVASVVFTVITVVLLNKFIGAGLGQSVVLMRFGIRQIGLLAAISLMVAVVASFLPVRKISKLKPIDAIQNRK